MTKKLCHPERKALVIGAEVLTRQVDYTSRSNAMLFGDASGAVVLEAVEVPEGTKIYSETILGADGNGERTIYREGGSRCPPSADHIHDDPAEQRIFPTMQMDGHTVFTFAVRKLDEVVRSLCARAGFGPEQLDWVFAHQANFRILESVARRMKLPLEKFYMNLTNIGNTSSASIPLCLDEAVRNGKLKDGQRLVMCGFGAGLTWAGALMAWPYL